MTLDWHFCPQSVNLLASTVSLDFLGFLERMNEAEAFMSPCGIRVIPYEPHANHATGAAGRLNEFIGRREAAIIQRFYENDFALYGYSDDLTTIAPVRPPAEVPGVAKTDLRRLLSPARPAMSPA